MSSMVASTTEHSPCLPALRESLNRVQQSGRDCAATGGLDDRHPRTYTPSPRSSGDTVPTAVTLARDASPSHEIDARLRRRTASLRRNRLWRVATNIDRRRVCLRAPPVTLGCSASVHDRLSMRYSCSDGRAGPGRILSDERTTLWLPPRGRRRPVDPSRRCKLETPIRTERVALRTRCMRTVHTSFVGHVGWRRAVKAPASCQLDAPSVPPSRNHVGRAATH